MDVLLDDTKLWVPLKLIVLDCSLKKGLFVLLDLVLELLLDVLIRLAIHLLFQVLCELFILFLVVLLHHINHTLLSFFK